MSNTQLTRFSDITEQIATYHADPASYKGKSTGSAKLDELITLKEGNLHIITGIPSSGKSELLDQIMLNTIALHDWHWSVFSPENWPLEAHFSKLAEKWCGKPWTAPPGIAKISTQDIEQTKKDLSYGITFLDCKDGLMNVDKLIEACSADDAERCTDALLLDPWNEMESQAPSGISETNYIGECLSKLRNFGRKNKIAVFIVAHPTKLQKNEDGNYPCPTAYDVAGSANWRNKGDVMMAVWRDYSLNDGVVQVHVQKVRNKVLGTLGMAELNWNWSTGFFADEKIQPTEAEKYAIRRRIK